MGFGVVCISRQDGAGGAEASRVVAEQLGLRLIDEDILARAAIEAGVEQDVVADAERRKSVLHKLLEGLGPATAGTGGMLVVPEDAGYGRESSRELRGLIKSAIEETATEGRVVIVAHAASLALAGRADVLRVFITASPATRQRRVAASLQTDEKEAARVLKRSDAARADYIKRFYAIDAELPTHYDLVINTDTLTPPDAARLIVAAMNEA
ncbi:MAG TPA: cytidylate kinase-like family protein [Solirubrobacteraceae bacterium]|jgi:cytidylate kinase